MRIVKDNIFFDLIAAIIDDAPGNFKSFRSGDEVTADTVGTYYRSNREIEGTNTNGVLRADDGWMYTANILHSAPMNEAKEVCDNWNVKLERLKEMGFKHETLQLTDASPHGIYGWKYSRNDVTVILELWPLSGEDNEGTLNLAFFNWR